jgi:hypothetical protein
MSTAETPDESPPSTEHATASGEEAVAVAKAERRGFSEWMWRSGALSDAKRLEDTSIDRALVQLAREHVELADRLTARIDVLRSGSGFGTALLLYREALVLVGEALRDRVTDSGDDGGRVHQSLGAGAPAHAAHATDALHSATSAATARLTERDRLTAAHSARALLRLVMDTADAQQRPRARAMAQRIARTGAFVAFVLGIAVCAAVLIPSLMRPPNLLEHSARRTSSSYSGFSPDAGTLDGKRTRLFLHTDQEYDPFVEFDMGKVQTLRHFEVRNRRDCCDDRALPLVIETSVDGKRFDEVARRVAPFKTFETDVRATQARFVRVHVPKKTWLHLERVAAW